jgi:hypothetical protein
MTRFLLHHMHEAHECAAAFAAWKGFASPLRSRPATCSCLSGGHELWWELEAPSEGEALSQLPRYVAERTSAIHVRRVQVP